MDRKTKDQRKGQEAHIDIETHTLAHTEIP